MQPGAWSIEHGAWSIEPGAGRQEPGAWSPEPGAWSMEPGAWSMHPGAWMQQLGPEAWSNDMNATTKKRTEAQKLQEHPCARYQTRDVGPRGVFLFK